MSPEVPDAFLPPSPGLGSPILGDPKDRRARPGSAAEAPRLRAGRQRSGLGGGTPPILSNPHLTGPRLTQTQRLRADRLARLERARRIREWLKSDFARGMPEGISPVLTGQPATADTPNRVVEVPPAMQAPEVEVRHDPHARPVPPADQAARRIRTTPPSAEQPTWEVETPGGPVVSPSEVQHRPEPAPRRLGGGN